MSDWANDLDDLLGELNRKSASRPLAPVDPPQQQPMRASYVQPTTVTSSPSYNTAETLTNYDAEIQRKNKELNDLMAELNEAQPQASPKQGAFQPAPAYVVPPTTTPL